MTNRPWGILTAHKIYFNFWCSLRFIVPPPYENWTDPSLPTNTRCPLCWIVNVEWYSWRRQVAVLYLSEHFKLNFTFCCFYWCKRISAPSHLIGQKGTENRLTYTLLDHSTVKKKKTGEKMSALYHSLVYFTVQQSTQGKQPELNSLNSSDILHLSWAGNALCPAGRVSLINERSAAPRGSCNADRTAGGSQHPATVN